MYNWITDSAARHTHTQWQEISHLLLLILFAGRQGGREEGKEGKEATVE